VLDAVGLGSERRMRLRSYSKGMIQRVGLAQAILNEPDVVFLDEPMSGLDPLGRRDVRQLMLQLRDRGCTVFFSSHILSDAEALCTRVAVVAQGRLVAEGRVADIAREQIHGWELVVDRVDGGLASRLSAVASRVTAMGGGRFNVELAAARPDDLLREIGAAGAEIVSLNPVRDSLEAFFVRKVAEAAPRAPVSA